jgi:hypothetical protein
MSFSAVGTVIKPSTSGATFPLTPSSVGDFITLGIICTATTSSWATALSSSNVTWTALGSHLASAAGNNVTVSLFLGQVTTASLATVTATFNTGSPSIRAAGQEFSNTLGFSAVTLDASGTVDLAANGAMPPVTPTRSGDLYWGYVWDTGTGSNGTTSGYVYQLDANSNQTAYNLSCANATQSPNIGDTNGTTGIAVMLYEASAVVPGPGISVQLPQPGGRQWQKTFRHRQQSVQNPGTFIAGGAQPSMPPQPGSPLWRRSFQHRQQPPAFGGYANATVTAGLATGNGAVPGWAPGSFAGLLALSLPAPGPAAVTVTAGLAMATGTAWQPGEAVAFTAGLAAGTGTAQQVTPQVTAATGLAAGTGTSQPPGEAVTVFAGLATGTGTSQPPGEAVAFTAGLAHGTETAQQPVPQVTVFAGLATGTGTAFQALAGTGTAATPGIATGTGTAQQPVPQVAVFAGLAAGTGTAFQVPVISVAGLAHGTGTAQPPVAQITVFAGLATGTGTASPPGFASGLNHFRVSFTEPGPVAVLTENALGATLTTPALGAAMTPVRGLSAALTLANFRATLAVQGFGATLSLAGLGAVLTGGTMQQASLTLSEFNDMTINIAVTNNGVAFNLTGYNLNLLLKSQAGVPDSSALVFSSQGGSPAITITNAVNGLATAQLPNTSLNSETYSFYRLDVVNASSQQQTTVYGSIIWVTL